ncbi:ATP-dependent RNA helicase DDX1-like isoform X2 [Pseudochaenichthys georgianus]|uniref:ATP-dependent RNA helicase DDX1-like isoform X2 n=1 Tax=Pseudochaenichthys georgianus TaxID=52239 RepID=UPI0039C1B653
MLTRKDKVSESVQPTFGNDLGVAFEIPQQLKSQPFFASCVLKNAELKFNSGGEDFKNAPKSGFVAMYQAPRSQIYSGSCLSCRYFPWYP